MSEHDETRKAEPGPRPGPGDTSGRGGITNTPPEVGLFAALGGVSDGTLGQTPEQVAMLSGEVGRTEEIPGYEIVRELGRGGMGVVYLARQRGLNREVAVKTILGGGLSRGALARFWAEAEVMAAVRHPNVVQVIELGEHAGRPFMAMEYVSGGTLAGRLSDGPLTPVAAAEFMEQVARGVAAAHEQGVVHRDLKPGNILIADSKTRDGDSLADRKSAIRNPHTAIPKVADFGLAKRKAHELTQTHAVMGTPAYMAPEQAAARAKFVGPPADVWALGVILYECVSGKRPFDADSTPALLSQIQSTEPTALRVYVRGVPRDLDTIVSKCLAKEPGHRYPTAAELADDLGRFVRGEPISARPLGPVTRTARWVRRNPVVAGLLAMVGLVTVGLVVSLFAQYRQALAQADTEREAKETAERATRETERREQAELQKAAADKKAEVAAAQAAQADDLIALLDDLFRSTDPLAGFFGDSLPGLDTPRHGQAAALGPFLVNARDRFRASLTAPELALTRAKLLASIGNGMKNLGMFADAQVVLKEALELRRAHLPESHPDVISSELDLGRIEAEGGDYMAGIERFRRVQDVLKRSGADPAVVLRTRLYEGIALSNAGLPEADAVLPEVVRGFDRLSGPHHKDTLLAKIALISWLLERQRWPEVIKLFNEFAEAVRAQPDPRVREVFGPIIDCQVKLAMANTALRPGGSKLFDPKTLADGVKTDIARLEKLVPEDHIILLVVRFELAKILVKLKEVREADALFARVVADARRTVGLAHPKVITLLEAYSARLVATKRADQARALFDEVEAANVARFGGENAWLTQIILKRAAFELEQKNDAKALEYAKRAAVLIARGKLLPTTAGLSELYTTAKAFGRKDAAPLRAAGREMFDTLLPLVARAFGDQSAELLNALVSQAEMLHNAGDGAAVGAAERALAILPAVSNLDPFDRVRLLYWCGRVAMARGQFADADKHFRDMRRAAARVPEYAVSEIEDDALWLAWALVGQGRYKEAVALFVEARNCPLERAEWKRAEMDKHVALARLAAGDRDGYRTDTAAIFRKYGASKNLYTLARLAWVGAIGNQFGDTDAAKFAAAYLAGFTEKTSFPWAYRGLAVVYLRAGNWVGVEFALGKAGRSALPVDHVIRGLVAVARGDLPAARARLAQAEELIAARQPTAAAPLPFADEIWDEYAELMILLAELREAVTPPVAPPPRPK